MSKITIVGNAVVVTSAMKLEDLATIKKYRPKALVLMGGENNKEEIFAVDVDSDGYGAISTTGAIFGASSHDEAKLATITLCMDGATGDIKDWVADKIGAAIINLNKVEQALPAVLTEIKAERDALKAAITLV